MTAVPINWPSARLFAEAVQCPALCFSNPVLRQTLPAVDRLGMPLVTSGQFAYVYKLNSTANDTAWAVRCFRGFLGDREARYTALDVHLHAHPIEALPLFSYEPAGILVRGERFPVLVMEWLKASTLDVYLEKTHGDRDIVLHLAQAWLRLMKELRAVRVAHGDLQHGNILVQNGQLRLVDLDGMFTPAMAGWRASEVGHQHYQHPRRDENWFDADLDNFSALVVYLSLIALAEDATLWKDFHDENLLFTKQDYLDPSASPLFARIKALGGECERLAEMLTAACKDARPELPPLAELVKISEDDFVETEYELPGWKGEPPPGYEIETRTREVARRAEMLPQPRVIVPSAANAPLANYYAALQPTQSPASNTVQTVFNQGGQSSAWQNYDPSDVLGNSWLYAREAVRNIFSNFAWIFVIGCFVSRIVTNVFSMMGMSGFVTCIVLGLIGLWVYGLVRAYQDYFAYQNALATGGFSNLGLTQPGLPAMHVAPPAAQQPQMPQAQTPWYRQYAKANKPPTQNNQTAPVPPLSPPALPAQTSGGARPIPAWMQANRRQGAQPQPVAPPVAQPQKQAAQRATPPPAAAPNLTPTATPAPLTPATAPVLKFVAPQQPAQTLSPLVNTPAPSGSAVAPPLPNSSGSPASAAPLQNVSRMASASVVGNRTSRRYHRRDCKRIDRLTANVVKDFQNWADAERNNYRPCMTCKPARDRMLGSPTFNAYHLPGCNWAQAISADKARWFDDWEDAERAGFKPCETCEPPRLKVLPEPVPPAPGTKTIIASVQSGIFHERACDWAIAIPQNDAVGFPDRNAAALAGFRPCSLCRP